MERVRVCALSELPEGRCRVVRHGRKQIVLIHREGVVHAIDDTCPHMGGSLGAGRLTDDGTIVCPLHGWEFRVCDGKGIWPEGIDVASYEVEVIEGEVIMLVDESSSKRD